MPNKIENAALKLDELFAGYTIIERDEAIYAILLDEDGWFNQDNRATFSEKITQAHKLKIDVELFRCLLSSQYIPNIISKSRYYFSNSSDYLNVLEKEPYKMFFYHPPIAANPLSIDELNKQVSEISNSFPEEYIVIKRKEKSVESQLEISFLEVFRVLEKEDDVPYYLMKLSDNDANDNVDKHDYRYNMNEIRSLTDGHLKKERPVEMPDFGESNIVSMGLISSEELFEKVNDYNHHVLDLVSKTEDKLYELSEAKRILLNKFESQIADITMEINIPMSYK